jgi:hypothetical protein
MTPIEKCAQEICRIYDVDGVNAYVAVNEILKLFCSCERPVYSFQDEGCRYCNKPLPPEGDDK